jgi:branched-chain amino acid transport system substrate-binding protein
MKIPGRDRRRLWFLLGAVALALTLALAACGGDDAAAPAEEPAAAPEPAPAEEPAPTEEPAAADEGPILIAGIQMLTGGSGYYGSVATDGIELAIQQINDAGGIQGRQLEFIVDDNASDDAQTVTLTRKHGDNDEVLAIVGPTFLTNLIAGQEVANEIGVPYIAGQGLLSPLGQPWSFKNTIPFESYVDVQLRGALGTLGLQKVATVVNKDNGAQVFIQGVGATTLEAMGVEEAAVVEVAEAQSNYGPQIAQLLDVEPEAILLDLTTEDGARFMQQAVARGYEGYFIAGDGGLSDNRLFDLSQGAAEGLIATDDVAPDDPRTIAFVEAFAAANPDTGFTDKFATWGYDSVMLLAEAMEAAETLDRESIRAALENLTDCSRCVHDYLHDPGGHDFVEPETYFTELTPDGFITWPLLARGTVCESLETPGCFIEE